MFNIYNIYIYHCFDIRKNCIISFRASFEPQVFLSILERLFIFKVEMQNSRVPCEINSDVKSWTTVAVVKLKPSVVRSRFYVLLPHSLSPKESGEATLKTAAYEARFQRDGWVNKTTFSQRFCGHLSIFIIQSQIFYCSDSNVRKIELWRVGCASWPILLFGFCEMFSNFCENLINSLKPSTLISTRLHWLPELQ